MYTLLAFSTIIFATSNRCLRPELGPPREEWIATVKSPLPHTYITRDDLPESFDWRNVDGVSYTTPIENQHIPRYCGSCFLHGALGMLNDRLKIASIRSNGTKDEVTLARQVLLNCGNANGMHSGSCDGGSAMGVFRFAHKVGFPDATCQEYEAVDHECSPFRTCMSCDYSVNGTAGKETKDGCYAIKRYGKYFVSEYATMGPFNSSVAVHQMKAEIFARGPISCSVDAFKLAFGLYLPGQILRRAENDTIDLNHVVTIAGWHADKNGTPYWIVRNSWGTMWGDRGWFFVEMGTNSIGIESDCSWALIDGPVVADYGPEDKQHMFPTDSHGYISPLLQKFLHPTSAPQTKVPEEEYVN